VKAHTALSTIAKKHHTNTDALATETVLAYPQSYPTLHQALTVDTVTAQIGHNAVSLVDRLPVHSHNRSELLHHLTQGIQTHTAADIFNVCDTTIRNAVNNTDQGDLFTKYRPGTHRRSRSDDERSFVHAFVRNSCPPRSGEKQERYYQYLTDKALYEEYTDYVSTHNNDHPIDKHIILCYDSFIKLKCELRISIRRAYWGQFDCPVMMHAPLPQAT
jgi:hypothetical protein